MSERVTIVTNYADGLHNGETGTVVNRTAGREYLDVRLDSMKPGQFIRFKSDEILPEEQAVRAALCA